MKVYAVVAGNVHEGDTVYKDYHTARREAEQLVDAKQEEDDEDYEMSPPVSKWIEWREDYWTNDIDFVEIKELKVI